MANGYDRRTGRWQYGPSPGTLPRWAVDIEEERQTWKSKDTRWQDDLPEEPPYDRVAGDNFISKSIAYQMNQTGRGWVSQPPGKPYGDLDNPGIVSTSVAAGNTEIIGPAVGWGWITGFFFRADYPGFLIDFYYDRDLIFNDLNIEAQFNGNMTKPLDQFMEVVKYDSHNGDYIVLWDPAQPYYYNERVRVEITNPDASAHTITLARVTIFQNQ